MLYFLSIAKKTNVPKKHSTAKIKPIPHKLLHILRASQMAIIVGDSFRNIAASDQMAWIKLHSAQIKNMVFSTNGCNLQQSSGVGFAEEAEDDDAASDSCFAAS